MNPIERGAAKWMGCALLKFPFVPMGFMLENVSVDCAPKQQMGLWD